MSAVRNRMSSTTVSMVGATEVHLYHNGFNWVMRFLAKGAENRLMLGSDVAQLRGLWQAFDRVTSRHMSQYPVVMVGGIAFLIDEARDMRALIGRALWESQVA